VDHYLWIAGLVTKYGTDAVVSAVQKIYATNGVIHLLVKQELLVVKPQS
jgi:hypothetical protein